MITYTRVLILLLFYHTWRAWRGCSSLTRRHFVFVTHHTRDFIILVTTGTYGYWRGQFSGPRFLSLWWLWRYGVAEDVGRETTLYVGGNCAIYFARELFIRGFSRWSKFNGHCPPGAKEGEKIFTPFPVGWTATRNVSAAPNGRWKVCLYVFIWTSCSLLFY